MQILGFAHDVYWTDCSCISHFCDILCMCMNTILRRAVMSNISSWRIERANVPPCSVSITHEHAASSGTELILAFALLDVLLCVDVDFVRKPWHWHFLTAFLGVLSSFTSLPASAIESCNSFLLFVWRSQHRDPFRPLVFFGFAHSMYWAYAYRVFATLTHIVCVYNFRAVMSNISSWRFEHTLFFDARWRVDVVFSVVLFLGCFTDTSRVFVLGLLRAHICFYRLFYPAFSACSCDMTGWTWLLALYLFSDR